MGPRWVRAGGAEPATTAFSPAAQPPTEPLAMEGGVSLLTPAFEASISLSSPRSAIKLPIPRHAVHFPTPKSWPHSVFSSIFFLAK